MFLTKYLMFQKIEFITNTIKKRKVTFILLKNKLNN